MKSVISRWGSVLAELDFNDILSSILSIPQFDKNSPELWETYFAFVQSLVQAYIFSIAFSREKM